MGQERSIAKNSATYVLALSLFCLAGALVFFSLKVSEVSQSMPVILQSIEQTTAKVEPVLAEVNEIRELVPPILKEAPAGRIIAFIAGTLWTRKRRATLGVVVKCTN